MNAKHTPGRWNKIQGIDATAATIKTESGITVATAYGENLEQTKANARLIVAAPELLGLLIEARRALSDDLPAYTMRNDPRLELIQSIDGSIAKATGQ